MLRPNIKRPSEPQLEVFEGVLLNYEERYFCL